MFPSISHLFLCWRGPKSIAKLDGGHGRIFPLGSSTVHGMDPFHDSTDVDCALFPFFLVGTLANMLLS